jgi:hypothetical protein
LHQAEHEQADAHSRADLRNETDGIDLPIVQPVADEAEVDQVEPDHQQAVGRRGQFLVLAEAADQEDLTVAGQRARHPDRHPDGDREIQAVSEMCHDKVSQLEHGGASGLMATAAWLRRAFAASGKINAEQIVHDPDWILTRSMTCRAPE